MGLLEYKKLAPQGWILTDECDALLFSCLHAVALGQPFDVKQAYWDNLWHRKPAPCDCSSTISRDMFLGLLIYCLHFSRQDIVDELWSYGWKHLWKMGVENSGKFNNRVWFTPGMISLLAQVRAHLRGKKSLWRFVPDVYDTSPGYRSHLTMLKCYLHLRMYGKLSDSQHRALAEILDHSEENPLVYALAGFEAKSRELLRKYWPANRLPTTRDWSEAWRTQRADGDKGFKPVPGRGKSHTGGDLLFVEHVLDIQGQ